MVRICYAAQDITKVEILSAFLRIGRINFHYGRNSERSVLWFSCGCGSLILSRFIFDILYVVIVSFRCFFDGLEVFCYIL